MENVNSGSVSVNPTETHTKMQSNNGSDGDDNENLVQGAVDIVDFYSTNSDDRKLSDASDACMPPIRPARKFSDCSTSDQRRISECSETLPPKPMRKSSQCSINNYRKFSTCSESSASRTPKKVSFSDDLPIGVFNENANDANENVVEQNIQFTHDYLQSLSKVAENTGTSTTGSDDEMVSSTASTPIHELNLTDLFPNSRKVSIHSVRSMDMSPMSILKSQSSDNTTTAAATPIVDTFLEQERRNSTCSSKSNCFFFCLGEQFDGN